MSESYDVIIIGAGPGGYVAAIRAAQLGFKTACVEKRDRLGGTCLNIGCIPSKALLQSSHLYHEAAHGLAVHGVKMEGVTLDLAALLSRKDKVVDGLTRGIEGLFKKNAIDWIKGEAALTAPGRLTVTAADGRARDLSAKHIVIATGSESVPLPGVAIDEQRIVSSTGALSLPAVPKHLVVVGGGYIGLELGSVWRRLGAEVTVVEFLDRITPTLDGEVGKQLQRLLGKQGLKFKLSTKVTSADTSGEGIKLTLEPAGGGTPETLDCDTLLVSIGRRAYTAGLGLQAAGVACDDRGRVVVDRGFRTNVEGLYAIGDVIAGPMLAHKAEEEGTVLMEMLAGQRPHVNYDAIPAVVYTWPECASVGKTEEELKAAGIEYKVGKFPFAANSRARCNGDSDGFVKILTDAANDRVLGVHIIGPDAGTMIAEAVIAMEYGASAEDIARTCHAHPTLSEAVKEAALALGDGTINM